MGSPSKEAWLPLTNANGDALSLAICRVAVNRNKASFNCSHFAVVDREDKGCLKRRVDDRFGCF